MLKLAAVTYVNVLGGANSTITPKAKGARKSKTVRKKQQRILWEHGVRFMVKKFSYKKPKGYWVYVKENEKKTDHTKIRNKGFYRFVWKKMLPKLGKSAGKGIASGSANSFAQRSVRVDNKSYAKNSPYIFLSNRRHELNQITPGANFKAIPKAKRSLVHYMDKEMKRRLERAMK